MTHGTGTWPSGEQACTAISSWPSGATGIAMMSKYDAIIVGAGPAGSTAAILLARAGWRVAIVEKHVFPRRKVCGECLSAASLTLLDALGIGGRAAALAGAPLRHVALVCGERMLRAPLPPRMGSGHRWGIALSREHLDALLLDAAQQHGVERFQPWQAHRIDSTPGQCRCHIRSSVLGQERLLSAPVLIDAHGAWEALHAPPEGQRTIHMPDDLLAFKANFMGVALEAGVLPVLSFPGGYGGLVMAGDGAATFAFCIRRDVL
ncbi:MAG TPA: FAD-dependent monooxygenase, partial [Rubrivivax sp.]|nr:FAD-dependent monooxygenase [Rubrivivax sp.]